jgi:hypothetical protein
MTICGSGTQTGSSLLRVEKQLAVLDAIPLERRRVSDAQPGMP